LSFASPNLARIGGKKKKKERISKVSKRKEKNVQEKKEGPELRTKVSPKMSDEQRQQSLARQVAASNYERLENFNFLLSRHDPAVAKSRHYSFDADSAALASLQNLNMEYDQTEGMGGISVSSYDSIEDERSPIDVRGYPYRGKS
jgi:hypothetical protein